MGSRQPQEHACGLLYSNKLQQLFLLDYQQLCHHTQSYVAASSAFMSLTYVTASGVQSHITYTYLHVHTFHPLCSWNRSAYRYALFLTGVKPFESKVQYCSTVVLSQLVVLLLLIQALAHMRYCMYIICVNQYK